MTLTELKYILAVARERHFGRAAEACHVSQPSLSVAVKKLEDELEVKIFERRSSELTITPIGEVILEKAKRVLESCTRLYGDQALRIRYLGEDATSVGRYVQGNGTRQRLFPLAYSEIIPQP